MAVKKLSCDIQSLFCSSIHLFSFKRVAEELVYNALDAKSTSIAIRIHIQEHKIQVVDNGFGIMKEDWTLLGQKYATSKFVDLTTFKSAPNTYGFRGQAIASIVDVSKCVKITSRGKDTDDTWTKTFSRGKEKELIQTTARPSKGTTVEVNQFLYNLNIQRRAVNPVNELNDIKKFLEQLSLVHNNVSFSLRDDSRNEIVFKVNKNKDIYQTLKSLYGVERADLQELQVEKNQYKAVAYISNNCNNFNRHQWVFLNKIIVHDSKLCNLIHEKLTKLSNQKRIKKVKSKNHNHTDDYEVFKNQTPAYYFFITCPYYDYECSTNQSLEFKNWKEIKKLVEKVVQFYSGEVKLKETKEIDKKDTETNLEDCTRHYDTRVQVKDIIKRILGSKIKKPGVSQMQNGIKGKLTKRKKKKGLAKAISTVLPLKEKQFAPEPMNLNNDYSQNDVINNVMAKKNEKVLELKVPKTCIKSDKKLVPKITKKIKSKNNNNKNRKHLKTLELVHRNSKMKKSKYIKNPLVKAFERPSDSILRKCNELATRAENCLLHGFQGRKQTVFINETVNYSNIIKNNENISVRQRVGEIIIHDYPVNKDHSPYLNPSSKKETVRKVYVKTSHDLVKTMIGCRKKPVDRENSIWKFKKIIEPQDKAIKPLHTFESHHYVAATSHHEIQNYYCGNKEDQVPENNCINKQTHFISSKSLENFVEPYNLHKDKCQRPSMLSTKMKYKNDPKINMNHGSKHQAIPEKRKFNIHKYSNDISSYTIDFLESKDFHGMSYENNYSRMDDFRTFDIVNSDECPVSKATSNFGFTYTLTQSNFTSESRNQLRLDDEYSVSGEGINWTQKSIIKYCKTKETVSNAVCGPNTFNVIFVSNSEDVHNMEPLNICEAILSSNNVFENKSASSINNTINSYHFPIKTLEANTYGENIETTTRISTNCGSKKVTNNISDDMGIPIPNSIAHAKTIEHSEKEHVVNRTVIDSKCEDDDLAYDKPQAVNNFNLNNRLRFLPKGMSPIFKNGCAKNTANQASENDYFEDHIYNQFADNVQIQTEVYEANLPVPNDLTAKPMDKVNSKLNKEHSSLTFDTLSLKEAKILGQVDSKFIASVMKGKSELNEYLVLFDQHAVHERIRLEKNLADYTDGHQWTSINLDDVVLKLSNDETLYLNNYKDKFTKFGLQWTIINNHQITLHAIPVAILGKNPRQVDKVINAVKSLISEEIFIIRAQKGSASLYPKSIMDLVFNEACRYAIKFGDRLSTRECAELIDSLSTCKTPFQCAHGRPVMAVILELQFVTQNYHVDMEKLLHFKRIGI